MYDESKRNELVNQSWDMHSIVENAYLANPAVKGDEKWLEKQRLLLADMALHLFQTAVKPGDIELDKLKNNLHAILTIADQYLPEAELKEATGKIYGANKS